MTETCTYCGRSLNLVSTDAIRTHRESTGFGAANVEFHRYCSVRCKALNLGHDSVLAETKQTRLDAEVWSDDGIDVEAADAINYAVP